VGPTRHKHTGCERATKENPKEHMLLPEYRIDHHLLLTRDAAIIGPDVMMLPSDGFLVTPCHKRKLITDNSLAPLLRL